MSLSVELRIQGHLDPRWSDWLDGLTLVPQDDGTTLLKGEVTDQTALYGLLNRLRDLNLTLLSINTQKQGTDQIPCA